MTSRDDLSDAVIEAFVEFEERLSAGHDSHSELERYRARLGAEYRSFRSLVSARDALMDIVDPPPVDGLPEAFGPYTLLRVIGSGGAGMVYDAFDGRIQRHVAVKLLRGGFERDGETFRRFVRESAAAARVEHGHIVKIHHAGEHDRKPFVAMERIDGPNLKAWAREQRAPVDFRGLAGRMAGIADALVRLHEAGIVHRDVKPSNIMVRPSGAFVLMDFGLAHGDLGATVTRTGEVLGTPAFMSPQQLRGDRVEPSDDVYSFGATLYDLLTGKAPFQEVQALGELVQRVSKERPPVPSDPQVPTELSKVALACLEIESGDRPTPVALRDDLARFSRGESTRSAPVTPVVQSGRRIRKHLPVLVVTATVIGLLLFGWLGRSATLDVRLGDGLVGEVRLDASPVGTTPFVADLARGRSYLLELFVPGFLEHCQVVTADGDLRIDHDRTTLRPMPSASLERGGDPGAFVFGPRGKVRPADLHHVRMAAPEDVLQGVVFFFTEDDDEPVGRIPFPGNPMLRLVIPDAVRRAFRPGDDVRVEARDTQTGETFATAAFQVVADEPELTRELHALDAALAGRTAAERQYHLASLLVAHGFDTAALERLLAARPDVPGPEDAPIYAGLLLLFEEMEADALDDPGPFDTVLAVEVAAAIEALPEDARRGWIGE